MTTPAPRPTPTPTQTAPKADDPPKGVWAPLPIPSFRWFLASTTGQMASLNMQGLVRGFLTYELTESFAALGTLFLINSIPGMLFALWGGVLADRIQNRKRIVQTGQVINALNATIVGLMLVTGVLRFGHLLIAAFLQGTVNSVMMPARQAMLPGVVGIPNLTSAVAVNAAARDTIRLLAPAVGGFLIHLLGAYWVYFLMAGTYLFASATLIPVRSPHDTANRRRGSGIPGKGRASGGWRDIVEGIRYVRNDDTLRPLLSFIGGGALCGALIVATLGPRHRGATLLIAVIIQGLALIAFSTTDSFWIAAPIAIAIGLSEALRMSLSNVLVQTYVQDQYRGRVMSAYMLQRALAQFGAFFAGLLAAAIGVQPVLGGMAAVLVLVATTVLASHQRLRTLA